MSYSPESVRNTSVSDQPTGDDSLGFKPYVTAIAEFLLNEQTKPPLTLSIEGEWGSGKSSFMKQLETYLREKGGRTVWFNAWRHDKAEAVWAAFALSFIKQISTPKEYTWQAYEEIFWGHVRLAIYRFDLKKGWLDLLQVGALAIFLICGAIAVPFILFIYGIEGFKLLMQSFKSPALIIDAFLSVVGIMGAGSLSAAGSLALLKSLRGIIGNPKLNLVKYLKSPDYAKQSAFIEEFHEDFTKIVDAYIGEGRVYVFIDDLDRCEHPKSADLMQAINLMIADDPSVVFILGMDREKVAASLAVKYENILRYLPSENSEIDADILERYSTNKGLAYGYTFIEKFVQLPFQIPQPSQADFEYFLQQLAIPQPPDKEPTPQKYNFSLSKFPFSHLFQKKRSQTSVSKTLKSSQIQPIETDNVMLSKSTENQNQESKTLAQKRLEAIPVKFDQDSKTVRDVVMMVAPALDYNPRRIKQFINLFRLKVYIGSLTGLFDRIEDRGGNVIQEPLTFEQLGKFIAISLKWPLLLLELDSDSKLFEKFFKCQIRTQYDCNQSIKKIPVSKDRNTLLYWLNQDKLRELLAYGVYNEVGLDNLILDWKFSLKDVNVKKLLQVSPKVVRQNTNLDQQMQTPQVQITGLPADFNIEMVDIPAGKFLMGSEEYDREKPIHEVTVKAFKMGKYPVTQAQYEAVMGTNPSNFTDNPNNPVEQVSWFDAQAFCEKLSQLTGENCRLPTEAEWEYACRAGAQTRYYFGDEEKQLGDYAWYGDNSGNSPLNVKEIWNKGGNSVEKIEKTRQILKEDYGCRTNPVGLKKPNKWALFDMNGNVWEWCQDRWHENYTNKPNDLKKDGHTEWASSNEPRRIIRGGCWDNDSIYCRSSYRNCNPANEGLDSIGFRITVGPP